MSKDLPAFLTVQDHVVTRRKVLTWTSQAAAIAAGSALIAGCGGGGGGGRGGSNPTPGGETGAGKPGDPVSPEQRVAALAAVKGEYERLCNGQINCSSRAVADFMLKMTAFQKVAIMPDGCVWGHFTDGQHYVVGNNLKKGTGGPKFQREAATGSRSALAEAPGTGVPAGANAYGMTSFINFVYPDDGSESDVKPGSTELEETGYESPKTQPTLEVLKNMPELGVFNWMTHGGMLNLDGSMSHALMTTTVTELDEILLHTLDLQSGSLIYYLGQYGVLRGQWRSDNFFAITPKFIMNYNWRFTEDSIVLIHACASDNAPFRAAFRQAGAALYGGWSKPVWVHAAADAMFYMLDYFTAGNSPVPTPNPRHRAYDYEVIKKHLDDVGVTTYVDPSEGGEVVFNFSKFRGEPGGTSPSIQYAIVQEQLGRVILRGSFGSVSGKVCIGTSLDGLPGFARYPFIPSGTITELDVIEWTSEEVIAELPPTGAGSAGYIAVQIGKHWSNTRAISRWTGKLNIVGKGFGTLTLHEELFFTFRADIGYQRLGPGAPLLSPLNAYVASPFEAPTYWKWSAEGSNTATFPGPSTVKVDWNGNGRINLLKDPDPQSGEFLIVTGTINRKDNEIRLLATGGAISAMPTRMEITDINGTRVLENRHNLVLPSILASMEGQQIGIKLVLNEDLSIAAGELRSSDPTVIPMANENARFDYTIKWDQINAEYKPHANSGT